MQDDTSQKILNIADILFYIVIVLSIIVGFLYLAILQNAVGVITGLIIAAIGILTAFVYRYLIRGFGEIVGHQAEQTQLLVRMTEYMKATAQNADQAPAGAGRTTAAVSVNVESSSGGTSANTAVFTSRSEQEIVCPVCNKVQLSNRDTCYSCGCRFIYKDEQPPQ
jgi:hypothetical protein